MQARLMRDGEAMARGATSGRSAVWLWLILEDAARVDPSPGAVVMESYLLDITEAYVESLVIEHWHTS